jgi:hypothetical protein
VPADSSHPSTQRRRSERVSKSLALIVRGIDLLGQPFEERTSTLAVNLHGCRYSSKHHLPRNTWVTLELPQGPRRHSLRARVAWIQRPHSVREFFQVAVELESPANVWHIDAPPPGWAMSEIADISPAEFSPSQQTGTREESEVSTDSAATNDFTESTLPAMTNPSYDAASTVQSPLGSESMPAGDSPLLREWNAELDRHASRASATAAAQVTDQIRRAMEEFERTEESARGNFSAQTAAKQEEFLAGLQSEFERGFQQTRELLQVLERETLALRADKEAALESIDRMAQARLQTEAAEAARSQQPAESSKEVMMSTESAVASWRERLKSEMVLAQGQWNELLQSSLDGNIERLVEQLSGRSQDVLRAAEKKMTERFAELRQPLGQMYSEARETLSGVKSALEQEVGRARSSLTEIEHSAGRMKEYSAQLEAASHDTLNELHRRLENILQAQTDEMNRRAENLAAGVPQRLAPTLDSLSDQLVERTMGEVESKLAPRIERASEVLRDLAAREIEAEESLRLHRERLRQVSENNQREVAGQMAATLGALRHDFEFARKEALTKWNEELDASGVRASHAAAESIGRSSEWFQQEARARLQVLVEQTVATAGTGFAEKTTEATLQFGARLEEQSSARLSQVQREIDGLAGEIAGRTRTQLDEAAEAAAASFGQVLRSISEEEVGQFTSSSHRALKEREQDLQRFAEELLRTLEAGAGTSIDRFHAQMASQLHTNIAEGRGALAAEFTSAFDGYRTERDAHNKEWTESLNRASDEAAEKYHDRLQTTCDSWIVSSVRRLNEHGQNVIESLTRSGDQAMRESCAKIFEGLSEMLRERSADALTPVGFTPGPSREGGESTPHNQSASSAKA